MNALKELFLNELADRYDAEKRLVRAMPGMAKAASCQNLQKVLHLHLKETMGHVKKVEAIFKSFGAPVKSQKCEATVGMLKEATEVAATFKGTPAINSAIVSSAQKNEHYEIASYGCLHEWAGLLGNKEAAKLLQGILVEERAANQALIDVARAFCNKQALGTGDSVLAVNPRRNTVVPILRRGIRPGKVARTRLNLI